ncbi:CDP-diacylglycerol--glycerol-3-phosphate 3-phosphatidyltransferase [Fenollaria sporofastidiosus]|uniref:CDP-diacylglycerol--glycerol-3-phosphate 3-phosphatidyltransferase n=1 Tax=Fenollaria sporofastidiosus TaxID=2811778 RepID=UPI001BFFE257|nr:CDP-diacylglycerol--glycerol-3-phosphate 3-phosphatidyltransferase [Fenollaria sporofastidiosus]
MNLANKITMFRIFLLPIFVLSCYFDQSGISSLLIFLLGSFSDFLDGYVARKYNMITDFGKFIDPIADKILVLSAFIMFIERGFVEPWVVIVVLFRELLISGFRMLAAKKNISIAADIFGKLKTTTQFFCVIFFFLTIILISGKMFIIGKVLLYISVVLTVLSMINYLYKNREVLHGTML